MNLHHSFQFMILLNELSTQMMLIISQKVICIGLFK